MRHSYAGRQIIFKKVYILLIFWMSPFGFAIAAGDQEELQRLKPIKIKKVHSKNVSNSQLDLNWGGRKLHVEEILPGVIHIIGESDPLKPQTPSWAVQPLKEAELSPSELREQGSKITWDHSLAQRIQGDREGNKLQIYNLKKQVILPHLSLSVAQNGAFRWKYDLDADVHFYGLGDKPARLDHRGLSYEMWNTDAFTWQESSDPLYKSIPFFMAQKEGESYGVFMDTPWRSYFDFGRKNREDVHFGADGGGISLYVIEGPHPKDVLRRLTALLGSTPLPPRWALGFQQSRWSYFPEGKVRKIAQELRSRRIPADVIYLDIDYQKGNAPFSIDREKFPQFERMISDFKKMDLKVVVITDLHIKKEYGNPIFESGIKEDIFIKKEKNSLFVGEVWPGDSVFPEFTLDRGRKWWGQLYKEFVEMGIAGFWNDMNEPALFNAPGKTMPLDLEHRLEGGGRATHRAIHNIYGMQNARATYEGLQRLRPNVRPFVLTRAAYAGTQRYAASWTGDNSSTWNHLRMMIPSLVNLGLSAYPFVGADIGGFVGTPPADLLTRWIQVGAFTPMFRDHTSRDSEAQEPWVHGAEHEKIRREAIEWRYRLLPYIYTSLEETTKTGIPLMRPLFLEYPKDPRFYVDLEFSMVQQFMFGSKMLIIPVVTEMLDSIKSQLPAGIWYNFWNGEVYEGGGEKVFKPKLNEIPVLVREGAIIPLQPLTQSTVEIPKGPLEVHVYPGSDCGGSLYWDDGESMAYQRREYLRMHFKCQVLADRLQLSWSLQHDQYSPWWKAIQVVVHGQKQKPKDIQLGGKKLSSWIFNSDQNTVEWIVSDWRVKTDMIILK